MSLDSAINEMQRNVPECVAVGVVDMTTGMLLGVKTVDSHPQEVLDLVAAATGDLYQGQNVAAIESAFKKARGLADDGHHYFQEILVMSDNLLHVFQRCKKKQSVVVVAVCRASVNLGMALTRTRSALAAIESHV
jgi:hypothetical protein